MKLIPDNSNPSIVYICGADEEPLYDADCPNNYRSRVYVVLHDDSTAEIIGIDGSLAGDLILKTEIDGHYVTRISDGIYDILDITTITLPKTLREIEGNPFTSGYKLMAYIVAPDHPYMYTQDGILFMKENNELRLYPGGLDALHYTVPTGVRALGDGAFMDTPLVSISIPDTVVSIGSECFRISDALEKIEIPDSVSSIGRYAFYECSSLESINIPASVTEIGEGVFGLCCSLNDIRLSPSNPVYMLKDGVLFSALTGSLIAYPSDRDADEYAIPEGTPCIGEAAFTSFHRLSKLRVPASVSVIEDNNFDERLRVPRVYYSCQEDYELRCSSRVTVIVERGSQFERYARTKGTYDIIYAA